MQYMQQMQGSPGRRGGAGIRDAFNINQFEQTVQTVDQFGNVISVSGGDPAAQGGKRPVINTEQCIAMASQCVEDALIRDESLVPTNPDDLLMGDRPAYEETWEFSTSSNVDSNVAFTFPKAR